MNAVSVCDGISAASEACKGLDYNFLLLSEIEAFPRSVLQQRHHAVDQRAYTAKDSVDGKPILWGDFTTIRPRHIRSAHGHADIDVLFGGTPCQSYSVAGKRAGLDDPRGELSLEYALLAYRLGVRWFLWENVPGVFSSADGEDFAAILSAFTGRVVEVPKGGWQNSGVIPEAGPGNFGIAWRVLDAQYAGVPQRRRRIFVVGHLGDWRRAAAVLFDAYSLQGHPAPSRPAREDVTHATAPCLTGSGSGRGVERMGDTRGQDPVVAVRVAPTVRAGGNSTGGDRPYGTDVDTCESLIMQPIVMSTGQGSAGALRENPASGPDGVGCQEHIAYTLEAMEDVAYCLTNPGAGGRAQERNVMTPQMAVRRLTPRECERLQGFPDDYTLVQHRGKPAADGPRYKALGNSWAVPCVRWIAERMQEVDAL